MKRWNFIPAIDGRSNVWLQILYANKLFIPNFIWMWKIEWNIQQTDVAMVVS